MFLAGLDRAGLRRAWGNTTDDWQAAHDRQPEASCGMPAHRDRRAAGCGFHPGHLERLAKLSFSSTSACSLRLRETGATEPVEMAIMASHLLAQY